MSNSRPIPIFESGQNNPNVYYNQAFSHSYHDLWNGPQSPPYYLDPRSPRTVFPVPDPSQNPMPPTDQRNQHTEPLIEETIFHKMIIDQVLDDVAHGLEDGIWGFLSYMEYNERVESTYIKGKEFCVNNTDNPISESSLGLASLHGHAKSQEAHEIRQRIAKGITLTSDEPGNVYLINESEIPVIIKDFDEPERHCTSEELIRLRGNIMPGNKAVKVFDIDEFRCHIGLQIVNDYKDEERLRHLSVMRMCFGEAKPGLGSPCWLLLVNLTALNMVSNEEVKLEMQDYVARLTVSDNKSAKENLPSKKKTGVHQEARRKIRIEWRKQNKEIRDLMKYSWDEEYFKQNDSALNMETLKQQFEEPEIDYDDVDGDDENETPEEAKLQVDLQKLKTVVKSGQPMSASVKTNVVRPVKHWAKLSYMVKKLTGEGAY